jgi:hypothetical protein
MAVATKKQGVAERKKLRTKRSKLVAKRNAIEKEIKGVEKKISKSQKAVAARPVGRPKKNKRGPKAGTKRVKNKAPLREFVEKVMKPGVGMTAPEVHSKLEKAGYKTNTKDVQHFHSTIGGVFRKSPAIKRVGHGQYALTPALTSNKVGSRKKRKAASK